MAWLFTWCYLESIPRMGLFSWNCWKVAYFEIKRVVLSIPLHAVGLFCLFMLSWCIIHETGDSFVGVVANSGSIWRGHCRMCAMHASSPLVKCRVENSAFLKIQSLWRTSLCTPNAAFASIGILGPGILRKSVLATISANSDNAMIYAAENFPSLFPLATFFSHS